MRALRGERQRQRAPDALGRPVINTVLPAKLSICCNLESDARCARVALDAQFVRAAQLRRLWC